MCNPLVSEIPRCLELIPDRSLLAEDPILGDVLLSQVPVRPLQAVKIRLLHAPGDLVLSVTHTASVRPQTIDGHVNTVLDHRDVPDSGLKCHIANI